MIKNISLFGLFLFIAHPQQSVAEQQPYGITLCSPVVAFQGEAYFCGRHRRFGRELFRSNGTAEGTFVVADIENGSGDSVPSNFFELGNKLYFFAKTTNEGRELWSTDGSETGTMLIKATHPGEEGLPSIINITLGENVVYFQDNLEVWRTDGTSDGTELLIDRSRGSLLGTLNDFVYYQQKPDVFTGGNLLLYRIREGSQSPELVRDFGSGCNFLRADFFAEQAAKNTTNNLLFLNLFCNGIFQNDQSIIRTDGTTAGTRAVLPGAIGYFGELHNRRFYFGRSRGTFQHTNGSDRGTLDICSAVDGDDCEVFGITEHTEVNGKLLFTRRIGDDYPIAWSLWSTDGTTAGSVKLDDAGGFSQFVVAGSRAVFERVSYSNFPRTKNSQLWITDGTAGSVQKLIEISDSDVQIKALIGRFAFLARSNRDPNEMLELWVSNGTPSSTVKLRSFSASSESEFTSTEGQRLYFSVGDLLWHTDGTDEGTYRVSYLDDPTLGGSPEGNIQNLVPILDMILDDEAPLPEPTAEY